MTRREQLIYLAGLLEGEGCFHIRKGGKNATLIVIYLKMTDEDVVQWAAEIMRGDVRRKSRQKESRKDVFQVAIQGEKAVSIMREILPFIGLRRSAKIKEAIAAHESRVTVSESMRHRIAREKRCPRTESLF